MIKHIKFLSGLLTLSIAQPAIAQKQLDADKVTQSLNDSNKYLALDLKKSPQSEYYLIKTQINNAEGYFLLDTGAYTTALTMEGAKALKLKLQEEKGSSYGIGGASKNYSAAIDKLVFGGRMALNQKSIRVLNIPALSKGGYGKHQPMGILGSDLLDKLNIVVNFRTHKLYYPTKGFKLEKLAKANGYTVAGYQQGQNVPTLPVQLGDVKMHMVFDSGAKTTVLDLSAAESNKLKIMNSSRNVEGAGAATLTTKTVYVPKLNFGSVDFTDFAASSIQLKGKIKNVDGIIGADLLFSSGLIMDYGSDSIFTKKQLIKANDLGLPSSLPMSLNDAKSLVTEAKQIYHGHVVGLKEEGAMKDPSGNTYKKLELKFLVAKALKGGSGKGEKIAFSIVIPAVPEAVASFSAMIREENERLLILGDSPVHTVQQCLFKSSSIRMNQVKEILNKK